MKINQLVNVITDPRLFIPSDKFPDNTKVGIEVEVEDCVVDQHNTNLWKVVGDGSLRGYSAEFVTSYPILGQDIINALDEFEEIKASSERHMKWSLSERVGVHVHMEILDLELSEFQLFLLFYLTFEKVLFKNSGDRVTNIHCLPFSEIDSMKDNIFKFNKYNEIEYIRTEKYISLNTAPIWNQGTVEFRFHEGSYDKERILNWVRILMYLKAYAKDNTLSLMEYPMYVSQKGIINFFREIFPEDIARSLMYSGIRSDIMEGVRFAQETIHREQITSYYEEMSVNNDSRILDNFISVKGINLSEKEET